MKKVFIYLVVGIFLSQQLVLVAKSQASSNIWIIIDGSGVGIQVVSDSPGSTGISSDSNMIIGATGTINPPDSGCEGDKSHYNGTLYGQDAPAGCGWGHVINYSDASIELQTATDILSNEESAHLELKTEDPDYDSIKDDLHLTHTYINKLLDLLKSKADIGVLSHKTYNKLKKSLKSVSRLDSGIHLSPSPSKEKDIKKFSTAYDIKVKIVQQIISLEPVLKPAS